MEDILEVIYDNMSCSIALPVEFYPAREGLPVSELYITDYDGKCWQITATEHPHER